MIGYPDCAWLSFIKTMSPSLRLGLLSCHLRLHCNVLRYSRRRTFLEEFSSSKFARRRGKSSGFLGQQWSWSQDQRCLWI